MNKGKDPSIRRNSNRLPDYDYSQDGAYFITIVTQNRLCLFGSILDGKMVMNDAGRMVEQVCQEMPQVIRGVEIGCFQIIPNHFHAIIRLTQDGGMDPSKPEIESNVAAEIYENNDLTVGATHHGGDDNLDQSGEKEISKYDDLNVGADLRVCLA